MKKVIQRFKSFEAANRADADDYRRMSPTERMDLLLELVKQEQTSNETGRGLERVYRIVELAQS